MARLEQTGSRLQIKLVAQRVGVPRSKLGQYGQNKVKN